MNYHVNINKGLIDINTLAPNKLFYYKVKHAKELNKSAYGCPISFYNVAQELIYYKQNTFAHELHSIKERNYYRKMMETNDKNLPLTEPVIKLVNWSKQGNWCYLLEYSEIGAIKSYQNIFLDLKNKCSYRIDDLIDNRKFVNDNDVIDSAFDENIILRKLELENINCDYSIPDKINDGLLDNLYKSQWYP